MSGSCGMGAVVTWQDGAVVITSINPLGPAAATGEVLVGDHIMSVGAVAVSSVEQARALILGPSEQPPAIALTWPLAAACTIQIVSRVSCLLPFLSFYHTNSPSFYFCSRKQIRCQAQAQHLRPKLRHVSRSDRAQALNRTKFPSTPCCPRPFFSFYTLITVQKQRCTCPQAANGRRVAETRSARCTPHSII